MKLKKILEGTKAEILKEEYIETLDGDGRIDKALKSIKKSWLKWKKGPATNYEDIPPAYEELEQYIAKWLNKNLK